MLFLSLSLSLRFVDLNVIFKRQLDRPNFRRCRHNVQRRSRTLTFLTSCIEYLLPTDNILAALLNLTLKFEPEKKPRRNLIGGL